MGSILCDARWVFFLIAMAASMPPILGDCPDTSIDAKAVRSLISAPDITTLDRRFVKMNSPDLALVAVYRRRRLDLHRTPQEEVKFPESLPSIQAELSRIYALTDSHDLCGNPYVTDVVYGMFDRAVDVIIQRGVMHRRFIELCDLTDGEVGEVAWPAFDRLLQADTERTVAALRSLSAEVRMRLCGGEDPVQLSDAEAADKCRSEL